jgi:regulator of replication initiation timing
MFISNAEKTQIQNDISNLAKMVGDMNVELTFLTAKLKGLEGRLTKSTQIKQPPKQKTAAQIQKQKEKQREYNRRYAAKKQFEKLEKQMAEKAERSGYATSVSAASQ